MICHILDLSSGNHCSKWKYFSYDSLCSNSTWKKKISFKDTQVFLRTFSRSFCGPLSQTIFQGNSEPLLSTSKSTNQPTNQPRKLQLKITPISMLFSTHVLQNVHLGRHLHCTHTSICTCSVNIQFRLLFFNHCLEFECPFQGQMFKCIYRNADLHFRHIALTQSSTKPPLPRYILTK